MISGDNQSNTEVESQDAKKSYREDARAESNGASSHDREGERDKFEKPRTAAMEVAVENNIEKAMKVLKRKLIKEGLFKELKSRRYYEKPSERKKRKHKESVKKARKEEMRQKRNAMLS